MVAKTYVCSVCLETVTLKYLLARSHSRELLRVWQVLVARKNSLAILVIANMNTTPATEVTVDVFSEKPRS